MAYPKAYRSLAYEMWREDRSQTATDISVALNRILKNDGVEEIPVDTVMDWKNRDHWEEMWATEVRGNSPQLLNRIASGVGVATLDAVDFLHQVVLGAENPTDPVAVKVLNNRIMAARTLLTAEITLISTLSPKKHKVKERNLVLAPSASNEDLLALEAKARSDV